MIQTAFDGLCMAIADSVPGVSGGTIAFILGFYDQFIDALKNVFGKDKAVRKSALLYLFRLGVGWAIGMIVCILLLSSMFTKNIYFMSSVFLGLTAASIPFIVMSEKTFLISDLKNIPFSILGAALVIAFSLLRGGAGVLGNLNFLQLQPIGFIYIFLSGMIAIAAMVLPGISGSTVLLIAGVYIPTIDAVKNLLHFNFAELPGLVAMGLGVVFGIGVSIHYISRSLREHRSKMVWLILGLMIGSLFAIVMGPTTLSEPVPALSIPTFNILGFVIGVAALLGLEFLKKSMSVKKRTTIELNKEIVLNEH